MDDDVWPTADEELPIDELRRRLGHKPAEPRLRREAGKQEVAELLENLAAASRSLPRPTHPPYHFSFDSIEYRLAAQVGGLDALFWSMAFRGAECGSADVGVMTLKVALAAQNQCRSTYLALSRRHGAPAAAISDPSPHGDAPADAPDEPPHESVE
ncbi:hypothetical protein [Methylovirgula sp. 4M-Z18]|uniref:hypothetical protein n=1 Tax=Methylovirgula sp. 4M-Z18 TaxID=2293567 RepID=UPI000E3843FD|nr:hypothetical protein [Methylovirgula sp. 4M-Z18]RFB78119.1 hypothetical protein DYH55_17190 [Methylovirgula sp. 4M-Z18]